MEAQARAAAAGDRSRDVSETPVPRWGPWGTPLIATAGVIVVSVLSWWLIADPDWGLFDGSYPQPTGAYLFWAILAVIVGAFNLEMWPFSRLRQPLSGLLQVATHIAVAIAAVFVINFGLGSIYPTFDHNLPDGAGYFAGALIVLIGFYSFATVSASWNGWPAGKWGLEQPAAGLVQFLFGFLITAIGVVVLIYPALTEGLDPLFDVPTTIGWFYSVIVATLVAAMLLDNWPWSRFEARAVGALLSVVLLFAAGTGIYFLLKEWIDVLVPSHIEAAEGFSRQLEAAQVGVCIVFWALAWGLLFQNPRLLGLSEAGERVMRVVIVVALGSVTYLVYNRWMAVELLHEPAIDGSYGGSPLTFINWMILLLLWFAVSLGLYGTTREARTTREASSSG